MPKQTSKGLSKRLSTDAPVAVMDHPVDTFTGDTHNLINIPLAAINPNPDQPRKFFDEERLAELADSIRAKGVLQPIIVKRLDAESFLLVAGERRYRASLMAGLEKIPAVITTDDEQEISLIENLQREDLNPIEEAEGLKDLADKAGYTHERLAAVIGKSRVTVTELLSLNSLPNEVKEQCRTSDIATKTHLLQVLREPNIGRQLSLWDGIKAGKFSTKQIRRDKLATDTRKKKLCRKFHIEEPAAVITVQFEKVRVSEEQIWTALKEAAKQQKKQMR